MNYYVYVIKLDDSVKKSAKFRRYNPKIDLRLPCYYIGQSCHDPETRFWQHKEGYKSNKFAEEYGLGLCPGLYEEYNPIKNRKDAEKKEYELTERLRKKGHGIWSH